MTVRRFFDSASPMGDVGRISAVAAEEPVITEGVEVPALDGRLVGEIGDLIGIDQARSDGVDAGVSTEVIEERPQSLITRFEASQERRELIPLRLGHRRKRIEGREDEPLLVLGQLDVRDRDRRLLPGEGKLDPEVAVDDVAGRAVDEDLGDPADFGKGPGERALLLRRVGPPIPGVRHEVGRRDVRVPRDPAPPTRRGRSAGGHAG